MILEKVGKEGNGKLWSFIVDMCESLSNNITDLRMTLQIFDVFSHLNEVI